MSPISHPNRAQLENAQIIGKNSESKPGCELTLEQVGQIDNGSGSVIRSRRKRLGSSPPAASDSPTGAIFGSIRWAANAYGNGLSRFDILRAATSPESPCKTCPYHAARKGPCCFSTQWLAPRSSRVCRLSTPSRGLARSGDASPD